MVPIGGNCVVKAIANIVGIMRGGKSFSEAELMSLQLRVTALQSEITAKVENNPNLKNFYDVRLMRLESIIEILRDYKELRPYNFQIVGARFQDWRETKCPRTGFLLTGFVGEDTIEESSLKKMSMAPLPDGKNISNHMFHGTTINDKVVFSLSDSPNDAILIMPTDEELLYYGITFLLNESTLETKSE